MGFIYYERGRMAIAHASYEEAVTVKIGPFISSTDGKTVLSSLTQEVILAGTKICVNEGTKKALSTGAVVSSDGDGWYNVTIPAVDLIPQGTLLIRTVLAGALQVYRIFEISQIKLDDGP